MKEVLTPGEKLIRLRKAVGFTQKELAGDDLNRSAISQIENGAKIYSNAAHIITNKINNRIQELKLDMKLIDEDYLLESYEEQIERYVNEYIEELGYAKKNKNKEHSINKKLEEINEFLNNYSIDNKLLLELMTKVIDTMLNDVYRYEDATLYSMKCIEISVKNCDYESVVKFTSKLIASKIFLNEYHGIFSLSKYAIEIIKKYNFYNSEYFDKIVYNTALAYRKLDKYEKSLEYLNILIESDNLNALQKIDIKNLTGKDLYKLKHYDKSEEILLCAKNEANKSDFTNEFITILENLCFLYIDKNNISEAIKYADLIENLNDDISNQTKYIRNLYYLVLIECKLDRLEYVNKNYLKLLQKLTNTSQGDLQYKLIKEISRYFIFKNSVTDLKVLIEKITNLMKEKKILDRKISEVLHEIAEYFYECDINYLEIVTISRLSNRITRTFSCFETYEI